MYLVPPPSYDDKTEPGPKKSKWDTVVQKMRGENDFEDKSFTDFFLEETTLHGVRYILGKNSFFRRIIWLVLVVGGSFIMTTQILTQVAEYQSSPIATNIEVKYPSSMAIPQFAICNINQFRISETSKHLFKFVSTLYNPANQDNMTHYNLTDVETTFPTAKQFLLEMSHQIQDMLILCSLPNGTVCTYKDFKVMLTDYGVCFSINHDIRNPIVVQSAGSNSALKMVFNIEDYENMYGPGRTNGLKLLVFDNSNIPLVSYDAIDLAPGFHSIMGMEYIRSKKVNILEGGTCVTAKASDHFPKEKYSVQTCRLDKIYNQIKRDCQCKPFNCEVRLPNSTMNECTITEHFRCVIDHNKLSGEDAADCLENCTSIRYKVSQSFSNLRSSIMRELDEVPHVPSNQTFQKFMKQRFNVAWEARARNEPFELKVTQRLFEKFDKANVKIMKKMIIRDSQPHQTYLGLFDRLASISTCFNSVSKNTSYAGALENFETDPQSKNYFYIAGKESMYSKFQDIKPIDDDDIKDVISYKTDDYSLYKVFADILLSPAEALVIKNEYAKLDKKTTAETIDLIGTSMKNFVSYFAKSNTDIFDKLDPEAAPDQLYNGLIDAITRYREDKMTKIQLARFIKDDLGSAYGTYLHQDFGTIATQQHSYRLTYLDVMNPPKNQPTINEDSEFNSFIDKSQTDLADYRKFINFVIMVTQEDNLGGCNRQQLQYLTCMKILRETGYYTNGLQTKSFVETKPPSTPNQNSTYYNMTALCMKNMRQSDSIPTQCTYEAPFLVEDFLLEIKTCAGTLSNDSFQEEKDIKDASVDFLLAYAALLEEMTSYDEIFNWGDSFYRNNYLAVDIFFSDLSQTVITQSHRYNIWALFCDIGGSLGLFLGASLLTFFELLDILFIQCVKAARAMKRQKKAKYSGRSTPVTQVATAPNSTRNLNKLNIGEILNGAGQSTYTPRVA